jgi:hypothetical protein
MKAVAVAETETGPLVEPALEGQAPAQVHGGYRQAEEEEGEQPRDGVGRSGASRRAEPGRAEDDQDLGEDEVPEAQLPAQVEAPRFDILLIDLAEDSLVFGWRERKRLSTWAGCAASSSGTSGGRSRSSSARSS